MEYIFSNTSQINNQADNFEIVFLVKPKHWKDDSYISKQTLFTFLLVH